MVSRPRPRQPPRRAAGYARGGLPLQHRHHRQGARVHHGREGRRTREAILPLLLPGCGHAPHHAPKEWSDKYKGKFDMGYEAYREIVFERQKKMGVLPEHAELSPINPYIDDRQVPTGKRWPELDTVRPWDSLSRRREAAVLPDGRGLRGLPQPRRPRDRPAARLSRAERPAREHDGRARLRQRRVRRGRPERLGQREQVLQRAARHDRGEPQVPRRPRHAR